MVELKFIYKNGRLVWCEMPHRLYLFISGFVEIASGLAKVLTLGYYIPNWDYAFLTWQAEKEIKKRMKNEGETECKIDKREAKVSQVCSNDTSKGGVRKV
jgi:hypothetical protein